MADVAQVTQSSTAVTYHCPTCGHEWMVLHLPPGGWTRTVRWSREGSFEPGGGARAHRPDAVRGRVSVDLRTGDCRDVLAQLEAETVDAVVTDPPYGLGFMGKGWDHGVPGVEFWAAALRVARPGAHLVAFGGTRTHHRLMCAIEDAGWEIRDVLMWLYGSGFPKSHNGPWGGTALKPAWEPIILARKPLAGTVAANVQRYGTGALNIDGCRIEPTGEVLGGGRVSSRANGWDRPWKANPDAVAAAHDRGRESVARAERLGRWPANLVLDEDAAALLDGQSGNLQARGNKGPSVADGPALYGPSRRNSGAEYPTDSGGASRFFYCAKASRAEREAGLSGGAVVTRTPMAGRGQGGLKCRTCGKWKVSGNPCSCLEPDFEPTDFERPATANHHPTVKPVALMRWLCRLVTPPGGLILDLFVGSGSTGVAAVLEGFGFLGIEKEAEYVQIADQRIQHASRQPDLWSVVA